LKFNLFFFILGVNLYAQNVIIDSITKKPIESVHILYNINNGLITNSDGYFELLPNIGSDSIKLSHISYKQKKINYKQLKKSDTIYLESNPINLDEIVLKSFNANDTILKAISRIDLNYLKVPHNSIGFFRQSMQEDYKGIEMVEVEFISYFEDTESQYTTNIINARRTNKYSKIDFSTIGGVFTIIEKGDFVKRKAYFLDIENINDYVFNYGGILNNDGVSAYKILFRPKNDSDLRYLRLGELYVDTKSLAFMEIKYSMDQIKLMKINELSINKVSEEIKGREPLFLTKKVQNIIKYILIDNNKWVLSSIEVESDKEGIYKNESYLYSLSAKLIVNKVEIDKVEKVKTNYNINKDFSKAIRKIDNLYEWDDTYKLLMSNDENRILKDINNRDRKN